ncbi:oxidase [Lutibacter sp.]|uniref:oxidase n=1 Tax=Lutibacter sp. TaxID=1925666 RepID=UPI00356297B2
MQDILVDDSGNLRIENGDFVIGSSTLQHQNHIIIAEKGEYKETPEIGVGVLTELLNENTRELLTKIRRNFEYDGMTVNKLNIATNGNILIDAEYN